MLFRSFIALHVTIAAGLVVSGNANAAADEPACGMLPPKPAELDPFAGFGFSYVNIGCNRPKKLKATLEHVLDVSDVRWKTIFSN